MKSSTYKKELEFCKDIYNSKFYNELLENEYLEIVNNNEFIKNHIHINLSYINEKEDLLELGIYITNNSDTEINIINLPICLYENSTKIYDGSIEVAKDILSRKSIFVEFTIPKGVEEKNINLKEIKLEIGNLLDVCNYPYIEIDIDNLPKIKGYKGYRDLRKFLKQLSVIKRNELRMDVFKTGEVEEGFCIIFLIRNSSDQELNIKSIPLTVYTEEGHLIYIGTQIFNEGLKVEANKGLFYEITIPFTQMVKIKNDDLSKYRVEFK